MDPMTSGRPWIALLCLPALAACVPETKVKGGSVSGTILEPSLAPADLATVYLVDEETAMARQKSVSLTNARGRFRIHAPEGTYQLTATDYRGTAAYSTVTIEDGRVVDVGQLRLEVCADPSYDVPGSEALVPCPPGAGAVVPPDSFTVEAFAPERTDVNRYADGVTEEVWVDAGSDSQAIYVGLWIPSTSPYYGAGESSLDASQNGQGGQPDFSATLLYLGGGEASFYLLTVGDLEVITFEPADGGSFKAKFHDAVFAWVDPASGMVDPGHTLTLQTTSPAMSGIVVDSQNLDPGPMATPMPPPEPIALTSTDPDYTQVLDDGSGGLEVYYYDDLPTGDTVSVLLYLSPAANAPGSHDIDNGFDPEATPPIVDGYADYYDVDSGGFHSYRLRSGRLEVSDAGEAPDDPFAAVLYAAEYWYQDFGGIEESTLTLSIGTSGLLSAVVQGWSQTDPADDGGSKLGHIPFFPP